MQYLHHSILQFIIAVMMDKISNVDIEEAANYKPIYKGPFDLSQFISKEDFPHFINQLDLLRIKPYIKNFDFDPYAREGKSYIETSKLMLMPNGDLPEVIITNYPLFNKVIVKYLEEFKNNKLQYPPDGVVLRFEQQMNTIKQVIATKYKDYERICLNNPLPQCRILECLILLYQESYIEFCPDISIKAGASTPSDVYFTITDKFKTDCLQYLQAASKNIQILEANPKIEQITVTDEDNKKGFSSGTPQRSHLSLSSSSGMEISASGLTFSYRSFIRHLILTLPLLIHAISQGASHSAHAFFSGSLIAATS